MANKKGKGIDKGAFNSCFKNEKKNPRHNPWGQGSTKNPTNSSQTTGP